MAEASYPSDLKYHPEHDWARIDGDSATLGITWYAQDQLGDLVFFDPPEVGATVSKDQPYAEVNDRIDDFAMLAVQGPLARALVGGMADGRLPARFHCCQRTVAGVPMLVCGTGYTGEDGVELLIYPDAAPRVWDALVAAGAVPCGLGARDTLRLEACFHLYGNDMDESRNPIEAGLGWCCKEATGFIGAEAVAAAREHGTAERLVPFRLTGPGIPRPRNPVVGGGVVTSGTLSPCLEVGIGLAYVPAERAEPGTEIDIDVRGKLRPAVVARKPLYGGDG